ALMGERRDLLDRDRQLYRLPLFEPVTPYESSGRTISQACSTLGIPQDAAEFVSRGLFPSTRLLFDHQLRAWAASRKGRAVVVTTGTGSGKTECYLIPIFSYLVEESARWGAAPAAPQQPWWARSGARMQPQRLNEPPTHPRAVRALLLYPLNA